MSRTALVVAGGNRPDPLVVAALPTIDFCVAADSGADNARLIGVEVDAVVGDMDSISPSELEALKKDGVEVQTYPSAKDLTDLELACQRAMKQSPEKLLVIGLGGGRVDHLMANMLVLAAPSLGDLTTEALVGSARISVIRESAILHGALGEIISLLPVHGAAHGVTTKGLEYPLDGETLEAGSSRGVSNRFVVETAQVGLDEGVLLALAPHALKQRDRTGLGMWGQGRGVGGAENTIIGGGKDHNG